MNKDIKEIKILGIETSCDDTGVSIISTKYDSFDSTKTTSKILSERVSSQIELHSKYGGVVPELASRQHLRALLPLTQEVFKEAKISLNEIDAIGVTTGPGLSGALLTGTSFACGLSEATNCPLIPVNHLEGHVLSVLLESDSLLDSECSFPFLALLISGGHTQLIQVTGVGLYKVLGQTIDDAAGEAFDKTALLLDLGYPGGPAISKLAQAGDKFKYNFPKPLCNKDTLNFSFSGLKTAVLTETKRNNLNKPETKRDIASSLEFTISEILSSKCKLALKKTGLKRLALSGGVASNEVIRTSFIELSKELDIQVFFPTKRLCTDNGTMIAWAATQKYLSGFIPVKTENIEISPRWPLENTL
jgi:N6-L-threonylcarbamoyladenine synthase